MVSRLSSSSTSTTASSSAAFHLSPTSDFSKSDEVRLREHISALKSARASAQRAIVEVEEVNHDHEEVVAPPTREPEGSAARLEQAVLMQELMAGREERADFKAQVL